jgi:hypothetical protein
MRCNAMPARAGGLRSVSLQDAMKVSLNGLHRT